MDKEEIEILKGNLEYMAEYEVDIVGEEHIKEALKYIDELEQKSEVLDKVTDKLKEKIELVEDVIDLCKADGKIAKYKIEQLEQEKEDLQEILNIIEGEKK